MFFFVDFKNVSRSTSYDKGVLFEGLVKELVEHLGYRDISLRDISNGKEYDIKATAKLGKQILIGQAKAWQKSVAAKDVSEFVGSLDNIDIPDDALGLFVSLSDFTPDAKEFLTKLKPQKRDRITTIVGEQIFNRLEEIGYISIREVKRRAEQIFNSKSSETYLLVSDRGNYFIQLLVRLDETRPKAFCVMDKSGQIVYEADFGKELRQSIDELKELNFLSQKKEFNFESAFDLPKGPVGPGPEGSNWFEYKLPATPKFFIGRDHHIDAFQSFLMDVKENKIGIRVYQILSPSGVGKSSLLLKLQSLMITPDCSVVEDARNFRSTIDLLELMQTFLTNCKKTLGLSITIPSDSVSLFDQLAVTNEKLTELNAVGIIFVDQFESLFLKPELYAHFLEFILRVNNQAKRIIFCIARRNDLPTTFDDISTLDLQRLAQISNSTELKDFSRDEVRFLFSHLADELSQKLHPKLLNLVLEFAPDGFPWLCKRVGAHIRDAISKKKITQQELIQNGIRPEALFDDDLAELDIMNREFLKELAKYLPATLDELSQKFEGKQLTGRLKNFHDLRLIRLIGRTYDTYNDVFKEYLKTGQVPLAAKYLFQIEAPTTKRVFETIVRNKFDNVDNLSKHINMQDRATLNVLRELRRLGLIEFSKGYIYNIDQEAIEAVQNDTLDKLLKTRVLDMNKLVRDVLSQLATQEKTSTEQLVEYLKEGLPILDISEKSWYRYAVRFKNWLHNTHLVHSNQFVGERRSLLNLVQIHDKNTGIFIPSSSITEVLKTIYKFRQKDAIPKAEISEYLLHDCTKVGLLALDKSKTFLLLTPTGRLFLTDENEKVVIVKNFLLSLPYTSKYLDLIELKPKNHVEVFKAVINNIDFTEDNWITYSKILTKWLTFAGLVKIEKGKVSKSHQISLF